MRYLKRYLSFSLIILVVLAFGFQACDLLPGGPDENVTGPNENKAPETTMANVPVKGDTLFANVELHWDGGDSDGFVDHYQWRYATVNPATGDTTNRTPNWAESDTNWYETDKTSLLLTFSSPNPYNKQIFSVRSVDNKGMPGDSVTKYFYTQQTKPPEVTLATPNNRSQQFFLSEPTDWFQGVQITYEGEDADGEIIEYGWAVNKERPVQNSQFTWTSDTSAIIPPSAFNQAETDTSGYYKIWLTAIDDTDLTSENPASVRVQLIEPTFDENENQRVLVIDETQEGDFQRAGSDVSQYDDSDVDSIYSSWISPTPHDEWDYNKRGMPPRDVLGQYNMVFWHGDNWYGNSSEAHKIGQHTDILSEYMNVGGDFIMSGWKILKSLRPQATYPATFKEGSFERDYLHINTAGATGATPPGEMVGGLGVGDYDDIEIDSSKTSGYPAGFFTNMVDVNMVLDAAGFTSPIYTFRCRPECGDPNLRGQTIGIRYFGTSFDAVVFGFPIFFMKEDDAQHIIDQILTNMGYREQPEKTIR